MKIAHLIYDLGIGGAELQVLKLHNSIKAIFPETKLIILSNRTDAIELQDIETEIFEIVPSLKVSIKNLMALKSFLKKNQIQLVHSHLWKANIISRTFKIFIPGICVVNTIHTNNEGRFLVQCLNLLSQNFSDVVTTVSNKASYELSKSIFYPDNIPVVDNYIIQHNEPKEICLPKGEWKNLLFVGRLSVEKNVMILPEILQKVIQQYSKTILHLVGNGPELPNLRRRLLKYGLGENVLFWGRQNPYSFYQQSDLLLLPSSKEGFGMVIIEAALNNLDIVTSTSVPILDILSEDLDASNPNDAHSFATEIISKFNHPIPKQKLNNRKQYVSARYDDKQITSKWLSIYQNVLDRIS